jgi:hypothetical protein
LTFALVREAVQLEVAQGSIFLVTRIGAIWSLPLPAVFAIAKSAQQSLSSSIGSASPINTKTSSEAVPVGGSGSLQSGSYPKSSQSLSVSPPISIMKPVAHEGTPLSSSASSLTHSGTNPVSEVRIHTEVRPTRIAASSHHFAALCPAPRSPATSITVEERYHPPPKALDMWTSIWFLNFLSALRILFLFELFV